MVDNIDVFQLLNATTPRRVQLLLRPIHFDETTARLLVTIDTWQLFKGAF